MRAIFLGNPPLGLATLKRLGEVAEIVLVVTQTEPPQNSRDTSLPVAEYAEQKGWKTVTPDTPDEITGLVKQAEPDVCVVAAYGHIIPRTALALADGRWLNVHSSLLPRYRGASPIQQAILDDAGDTGATIMEVSDRVDAGAVVAQVEVPIGQTDTAATLTEKVAERGAGLLAEVLPDYVAGLSKPRPQDEDAATMTGTLTKADGRIDWNRDAAYLGRFIRAMQPWPGAWTEVDGKRMEILEVADGSGPDGPPGTFDGPPLRATTGSDSLRIKRLKPAGKPTMPGDDWFRGRRVSGRFT
ncbi:MAG TPA: methionyl-tRNA formyltransferase [Patescibacteria group bacterium]|jgi:methionyl-tRNA formyltransferase